MVAKYRLFVVAIALTISTLAYANDEWILRIIKDGSPGRLVALLLYLESHPELEKYQAAARSKLEAYLKASPLSLISSGELPLMLDDTPEAVAAQPRQSGRLSFALSWDLMRLIMCHVAAMPNPTLRDVARLRRVNKRLTPAVDSAMLARVEYVIDSPESLALLMMLQGPMLRAIGSLKFKFGHSRITPPAFPVEAGTETTVEAMTDACDSVLEANGWTTGKPEAWDDIVLLCGVMRVYWPLFLNGRAADLRQIHSLDIEGIGPNDWGVLVPGNPSDYFFIAPLLQPFNRFPALKRLRAFVGNHGESAQSLRFPLTARFPSFRLCYRLRELRLNRVLICGAEGRAGFLDRVSAGDFDELRVLHLGNVAFGPDELLRLIGDIEKEGRLPHLVEFYMHNLLTMARHLAARLARALTRLESYTLGGSDSLVEVFSLAQVEGGFENLHVLDGRRTIGTPRVSFGAVDLHALFPALEYLTLSLTDHRDLLLALLAVPANEGLIEVVDDVSMFPAEEERFWRVTRERLLPFLRDLPARVLRTRPGLAGVLARLEERVVIEWIDEPEPPDEEEPNLVNFGVQQRVPVERSCTLL